MTENGFGTWVSRDFGPAQTLDYPRGELGLRSGGGEMRDCWWWVSHRMIWDFGLGLEQGGAVLFGLEEENRSTSGLEDL